MSAMLDVLNTLLAANDRRDKAAVLAVVTPDLEYHYHVGTKPLVGPEKLAKFLDYHWGHTRDLVWKIDTHAETGNKLLVEGTEGFTDTNTGQQVFTRYMGIFEFRDGRIARWRDYFQRDMSAPTPAVNASTT